MDSVALHSKNEGACVEEKIRCRSLHGVEGAGTKSVCLEVGQGLEEGEVVVGTQVSLSQEHEGGSTKKWRRYRRSGSGTRASLVSTAGLTGCSKRLNNSETMLYTSDFNDENLKKGSLLWR